MADRYLLESGAPDGYLLEDGSGVYILDTKSAALHTASISSAAISVIAISGDDASAAVVQAPLKVISWPLTQPAVQPVQTWTQNLLQTTLAALAQAPFAQSDWPLAAAPGFAVQLRSWAWTYNLNLIGQDRLPPGAKLTDLVPRPYQHHVQLRSWTWQYNLNLIGKDQLPVGARLYELPPRAPPVQFQQRSWLWWFNLNLIGQDAMTAGDVVTDRPPVPSFYRDWSQSLLQLTLAPAFVRPFVQTDWPLPVAPPLQQLQRTWLWQYNPNLIGQDVLPTGVVLMVRPPVPPFYRDWSQSLLQTTLRPVVGDPFAQRDWPLPGVYVAPQRSWTASYNLNLIGQDALPVGAELTARPVVPGFYRDWYQNLLQSTLSVAAAPFSQTDWPLPATYRLPQRGWVWSFNLNLIGQDRLPVGDIVTELPKAPPPHAQQRSFTQSFNLNLIGQDSLPAGGRTSIDLPPQPAQRAIQLRTWAEKYNPNLIGKDVLTVGGVLTDRPPVPPYYRDWSQSLVNTTLRPTGVPFFQTQWPLTPAQHFSSSLRTWLATYNKNLVGKDRLPPGKVLDQRTWQRSPTAWPTAFTGQYNKNLIGKDRLPHRQMHWPLTPEARYPASHRSWIKPLWLLQPIPQPPPVIVPVPDRPFVPGWQWQAFDRAENERVDRPSEGWDY